MSSSTAGPQVFADRLCPRFSSILQLLPEIAEAHDAYEHYSDYKALLLSAQSGFYLCHSAALGWENISTTYLSGAFSRVQVFNQKPFTISLSICRRDHGSIAADVILQTTFNVVSLDEGERFPVPKLQIS